MCTSNIREWKEQFQRAKRDPLRWGFWGALKWHLCNLGQVLDRRLKLRTALHEGTEGQLSKTHGEPRELIALHAHVATVRGEILTASSCGNGASFSAEGKRSLQWTHTTHFCCLQTFADSTQQSEERRRERQKQADEMTKHPCLFVFFTPHSYFTQCQGKTQYVHWKHSQANMAV